MPIIEFAKLDLNQLRQLSRELADEIEQRLEKERERAALEIKGIASSLGLTVEEIMADKKTTRGRKSKAGEHLSLSASNQRQTRSRPKANQEKNNN